jgi:uncharacterized protein (DUF1330 family)
MKQTNKTMEKTQVVVHVRGGLVTNIASNNPDSQIIVIDWDNINHGYDEYPNKDSYFNQDFQFYDLEKYLNDNKPNENKYLIDFFIEHGFDACEYKLDTLNCVELSKYTKGGVEINFQLEPFTKEEFNEYIIDFDVDKEIELYRNDPKYKANFTIRESLDDFKDFYSELVMLNKKLQKYY